MGIGGKDLGEDVGKIVPRCHEDKAHDFSANLLTEPRHLDTKVSVAACNHVIVNHRDASLIIFE